VTRFLSGLVSLSLILATTPAPAWAQVSSIVRAAPSGAPGAIGAQSGAASLGALVRIAPLSASSLAVPSLNAFSAPSAPMFRPGLQPFEFALPAAPAAARPAPAPKAAPAAAAPEAAPAEAAPSGAPAPALVPRAAPSVRVELSGAAAELNQPGARPEFSLERLFAGAAVRAALEGAVTAPTGAFAAASPLAAASALDEGAGPALAAAPVPNGAVVAVSNGGGLVRRSWEKLKGLYRVLPDDSRNRAFWAYTLGQSLATLGMDFHYTALPNLIAPTKADTAKLGYNRAANWGAQAAGSLMTGPFVDRHPVKGTLVWTYVGRGVLMALVPVLLATGHFGFAVFSLLIAMAGFLQATGGTAGSVAFNRILGDDEAYYNRANAILTIVTNVVGVVGPLMAGAFIAWAGTVFALPLMGSALSYGVYAILLLATGVGYGIMLKLPRDEMLQARRDLLAAVKKLDLGGARVKGVTAGRGPDGRPALFVEIKDVEPASVKGLPTEFAGYPVSAAAPRKAIRELIDGVKLTWSDKFLRLYLMLSTLSIASGDSLVFAVMPRYLADVLKAGPGAFGLFLAAAALGTGLASGAMTLIKDPVQKALSPAAVEFRAALAARDPGRSAGALDRSAASVRGSLSEVLERYKAEWREGRGRARLSKELAADVLAEAAAELGRVLVIPPVEAAALLEESGAASDVRLWAARRGVSYVESARRDAKSGMDSLQRQGKWSNLLHAASWLAYAGVFFVHALWPSVALMLLSALLAGPANVIWASLTTRVVAGSFPNDQGKVYSAMTFYMLAASVVGVLGLGWMMTLVPTATGLLVAGGILLACAVFDVIQSFAVFPLKRR
jgi:hypothetical protein